MSTTYPKCRTCRHLDTDGDESICRMIDGIGAKIPVFVWASRNPKNALLCVLEPDKFGCLLHSELETDQQKGEG